MYRQVVSLLGLYYRITETLSLDSRMRSQKKDQILIGNYLKESLCKFSNTCSNLPNLELLPPKPNMYDLPNTNMFSVQFRHHIVQSVFTGLSRSINYYDWESFFFQRKTIKIRNSILFVSAFQKCIVIIISFYVFPQKNNKKQNI